jgi:hypothetical protein
VAILLLQRCSETTNVPKVSIVRDTTWVVKDSLITSKPQIIKTISIASSDTIINHYIPDTNYAKLVIQYQDVVNQLLAKNIQQDSVLIDDTLGYVKILDTVQKNIITGRSVLYSVKYPIIKETITIPAKKVNQLYIGGEVVGGKTNLVSGINAGLLFKNKKDQIFGLKAGLTSSGDPVLGVSSFWKITLKK